MLISLSTHVSSESSLPESTRTPLTSLILPFDALALSPFLGHPVYNILGFFSSEITRVYVYVLRYVRFFVSCPLFFFLFFFAPVDMLNTYIVYIEKNEHEWPRHPYSRTLVTNFYIMLLCVRKIREKKTVKKVWRSRT